MMASKRNSRVFTDEATHHEKGQPKNNTSTYRSRRNSRSSGKEELAVQTQGEGEEVKPGGSSIRESIAVVRSQTMAVNKEASVISATMSQTKEPILKHAFYDELAMPLPGGRPDNFGVVIAGVYRSSYPKGEHFNFLQQLKLKTMVTLVKKEETDHELQNFVSSNGINQIVINMKGTKKEAIPPSTMKSILQVVLDRRNYPLVIHCNHGKHRTGCVVAAMRKMDSWSVKDCLNEYVSYAQPKVRETDVDYIQNFQYSELQTIQHSRFTPQQVRNFCRLFVFSGLAMLLWLVSGRHMMAARNQSMPT